MEKQEKSSRKRLRASDYVNMQFKASNGQMMTVTGGTKTNDMTVRFEDGAVVKNARMSDIKKGAIRSPNASVRKSAADYIGQRYQTANGQMMTITGGNDTRDMTVRFEDGTVVEHVRMSAIKRGEVRNPNAPIKKSAADYIGQRYQTANGQMMTVTEGNDTRDMTVRFEDGTVVEHVRMSAIKRGEVRNPNAFVRKSAVDYIGQQYQANNSQMMTVIAGNDTHDMTVRFEDGAVADHIRMDRIKKGAVRNPFFLHNGRLSPDYFGWTIKRKAYTFEDNVYFEILRPGSAYPEIRDLRYLYTHPYKLPYGHPAWQPTEVQVKEFEANLCHS